MTGPVVAEWVWFAIAPDGTEHDLVLRVGVPIQASAGEWISTVSLGVLESRSHAVVGVDAWQSIVLALQFTAARIRHFADRGWRFSWTRGGASASAAELEGVLSFPPSTPRA